MASIQGLQKALDSKTFDPSDFTQDQLILVDELIKTGNLKITFLRVPSDSLLKKEREQL